MNSIRKDGSEKKSKYTFSVWVDIHSKAFQKREMNEIFYDGLIQWYDRIRIGTIG